MSGESRLSRLVVSEEHIRSINACLDQLVADANTKYALLIDRSGQLITARGDPQCREVDSLGALLAGNFASAREIARLIGEERFGAVFQQGQRQNVFTALVSEHWMVSVVFDSRSAVGLVKVLCQRVAVDLAAIHLAVCQESHRAGSEWSVDQSFRVLAQQTIDVLLRDGG